MLIASSNCVKLVHKNKAELNWWRALLSKEFINKLVSVLVHKCSKNSCYNPELQIAISFPVIKITISFSVSITMQDHDLLQLVKFPCISKNCQLSSAFLSRPDNLN